MRWRRRSFGRISSPRKRKIRATPIFQLTAVEEIPDSRLRIEFGSVPRQTLQVEPFGCRRCEKRFDCIRPVNGRAIPDQHQLAGDLAQKQAQKSDYVFRTNGWQPNLF